MSRDAKLGIVLIMACCTLLAGVLLVGRRRQFSWQLRSDINRLEQRINKLESK